jgi:hypothetical protein
MRYFSNFFEDRSFFYIPDASSASNNPYLGSTTAKALRANLTNGESLTKATTGTNTTADTLRDSFVDAGSNKAQIFAVAQNRTDNPNNTMEWTTAGATIPKTEATGKWQARFGDIPLKADGTLDTKAMEGMAFAEFERLYPTYNSDDARAATGGGLDLGGYTPGEYAELPFDQQMQIAYAQKDAQMRENDAKFQAALQSDRKKAEQQTAAQPQQAQQDNTLGTILSAVVQGAQLFMKAG